MRKQSHFIEDFAGVVDAGGASPLSPVWHTGRKSKSDQRAIHPLSPAREGVRRGSEDRVGAGASKASQVQKQTHFISGFVEFFPDAIGTCPLSLSERGWPARLMPWLRSIERDGRVRGGMPRRPASSKSQKQTHLMPNLQGLFCPIPLPLQAKGSGVRSAAIIQSG